MSNETVLESTNPLGVLHSLHANRFTVFENQSFEFSPGLNLIVGENGAGKTHLLKLAYAATKVLFPEKAGRAIGDEELPVALNNKLLHVFLPDDLGRLRRVSGAGKPATAKISLSYRTGKTFEFKITNDRLTVTTAPDNRPSDVVGGPVYLPPREVMSLVPTFVSDYERFSSRFEETYFDLAKLLLARPQPGPRPPGITDLLDPLEKAMGGVLRPDELGRLYLVFADGKRRIEAPLVSEGYRKLATLAYLIQNRSLAQHGSVFWDEPEANLNPRLMRPLAKTLVQLAKDGVQLFIATHSLFFMREIAIHVDKAKNGPPTRYFSLTQKDGELEVHRAEKIDDLVGIAALDAAIDQDETLERLSWESLQ